MLFLFVSPYLVLYVHVFRCSRAFLTGDPLRWVCDIIAAPLLVAQFVVYDDRLSHSVPRSHVIQADVRDNAA